MATIGKLSEFQPEKERISAYLERVQMFFEANDIAAEKQVAVLLTAIGGETYALLRSLLAPVKPKDKSFEELSQVLQRHFEPKPLIIAERFHFHRRNQAAGETIAEYVAELRRLAAHCDFGDYLEEALRDRLVCGLCKESIQKRLLSEASLTLSKAVELSQSMEAADRNAQQLQGLSTEVQRVVAVKPRGDNSKEDEPGECFRCGGRNHQSRDCRFKGVKCHKCKRTGHLARVCRSRGPSSASNSKTTKWVGVQDDFSTESSRPIFRVGNMTHDPFLVELQVQGKTLTFEVDTGAAVTLISEETYSKCFPKGALQKSATLLKSYTGAKIPVAGEVQVTVSYGQQGGTFTLYVVKGGGPSLLGRDWLRHIRLDWKTIARTVREALPARLEVLLQSYSEVFGEELGTMNSVQARLQVKPDAQPKFFRPRSVPFALKEAIELELDRLTKAGIIEKVDHSDWAAPVVPVPKGDGQLRLCGDYKVTINPVLVQDQYPLPKPNDLMAQLAGGQRFSKLDLSRAYQQIRLEEASRPLVTINTHKGLYQYTRLPFGVASAPALFQKTMDSLLQGIPHTLCYLDDILVTGTTEQEHLSNLEEVLKRLKQHGLRVNPSKCAFLQESVEYLGHRLDSQGVHTTSSKVEAIQRAPRPQNTQELRYFLGLLHYYGKFIPNLSSLLHPLNRLLKAGCHWKWDNRCDRAFREAKEKLVSAPVLAHYDPSLPLRLAADASAYGVGAVISHTYVDGTERPIAYASRTLSAAERNYSQIDKEALALVFAVQKFHPYLYGRKFVLLTDHKPLVTLLGPKKAIPPLAAARLQRWAILLSAYSYDIEFKPTLQHANADGLSRLPLAEPTSSSLNEVNVFNMSQVEALPVTSDQIETATRKDPVLSRVLRYTRHGWPMEVGEACKPYWNRRHELTVEGDCLLWGIRVLVPKSLQMRVLNELHRDHPGVVRMKAVARSHVWWAGLDKEIEELVRACPSCQAVKNAPPVAPLHPWLWPSKPWKRIHADFAGPFKGKMFLLVTDAHSKWPEIVEMSSTTATKTVEELRRMFAAYGLPEQLVTDNGPQFTAEEFAVFLKRNGIKHIKVAPYHPSSNGAVERLVQTFKKAMRAGEQSGLTLSQRLSSFLLTYRSTPHATTNLAPCELFLKRMLRTRLDLLRPSCESTVHLQQANQKFHHDQHTCSRVLMVGQNVMARNLREGPHWVPGVVIERLGPLTYLIQVESGLFWRRHVDHLRVMSDQPMKTDPLPTQTATNPSVVDPAPSVMDPGLAQEQLTELSASVESETHIPTSNSETVTVSNEPSPPSSPVRRYPLRDNRRPPDRLM